MNETRVPEGVGRGSDFELLMEVAKNYLYPLPVHLSFFDHNAFLVKRYWSLEIIFLYLVTVQSIGICKYKENRAESRFFADSG